MDAIPMRRNTRYAVFLMVTAVLLLSPDRAVCQDEDSEGSETLLSEPHQPDELRVLFDDIEQLTLSFMAGGMPSNEFWVAVGNKALVIDKALDAIERSLHEEFSNEKTADTGNIDLKQYSISQDYAAVTLDLNDDAPGRWAKLPPRVQSQLQSRYRRLRSLISQDPGHQALLALLSTLPPHKVIELASGRPERVSLESDTCRVMFSGVGSVFLVLLRQADDGSWIPESVSEYRSEETSKETNVRKMTPASPLDNGVGSRP